MFTLLVFIIVLGVLVFVHELGHFVVARRNGVSAEEFGFGFPPRILGFYWDEKGKRKIVWGGRRVKAVGTIYSINWIPLGGFVKIVGEDGEEKNNPNSFASKSPWTRVRMLAAGVAMNFLLAGVLLSAVYFIGAPQVVEDNSSGILKNEKIQIIDVIKGSPAADMGIKIGDQVISAKTDSEPNSVFGSINEIQSYIHAHEGEKITFDIKRGNENLKLSGIPRKDYPADQGSLGISLAKTAEVSYPLPEAVWRGIKSTFEITWLILTTFAQIITRLLSGQGAGMDVSGPVGIAVLTGQVAHMGLVYVIQFMALLSINLAIINALPIPALDGGRVLFVLIEAIKGSPVSQKFEQRAHNIGFALLITLMVVVTFQDLMRFDVLSKVKALF
ncbi:MAG: RIP metalloprotease RseP [Parcubacteria group bacterium]|jgi:regulator of sigma E protease